MKRLLVVKKVSIGNTKYSIVFWYFHFNIKHVTSLSKYFLFKISLVKEVSYILLMMQNLYFKYLKGCITLIETSLVFKKYFWYVVRLMYPLLRDSPGL